MYPVEKHYTDVLILGAGGAGLRAAIQVAEAGCDVTVLSKELCGAAHTCMAEGGLNVALAEVNPQDSPAIHFLDTIQGGAWLNNERLAHVFTQETPDRVRDLERYGAIFDRTENGQIAQRYSGKQTVPHTIFVGDYTGQAIMAALVAQTRRLRIRHFDEHFVTRLFLCGGQVCGALALDIKSGHLRLFHCGAILLATGGGGRMYAVTTNAASNTADGYAMALRIGVELVDMEMVQFHPTGMVRPLSARGLLVTESVRGEGGILRNRLGDRFMVAYDSKRMELAGRDEVARAIYSEVQAGRGTSDGGVYLDVSHLEPELIEDRLPKMLQQFMVTGVDIRREPMVVHPSMHHLMGGIRINELGESNVPGLFAAGEVTGGVHGGNRLGGNALAECQVYGRRAAASAVAFVRQQRKGPAPDPAQVDHEVDQIDRLLHPSPDITSPSVLRKQLQLTMWNHVGIVRKQEGLHVALSELASLQRQFVNVGVRQREIAFNRELIDCLELKNMVLVAQGVIECALWRCESRGAHYRSDFPKSDEMFGGSNSLLYLKANSFVVDHVPVVRL